MSWQRESAPIDTLASGNRLIDSLPVRQRKSVIAQCEKGTIAAGSVVCDVGEPFKYVYFPIGGSISLTRTLPGQKPVETDSIGNEGMLGAALVLNIDRAYQRGIAQTPCVALRMSRVRMRAALKNQPTLLRLLQRYLHLVLTELSQRAGCVHFHEVERRLSRSLLQAHDRSKVDFLPLTHQMLAEMLGVQRGAITNAASKLQKMGIIYYRRGKVSILDRKRLEESSCVCYGESVANYSLILS